MPVSFIRSGNEDVYVTVEGRGAPVRIPAQDIKTAQAELTASGKQFRQVIPAKAKRKDFFTGQSQETMTFVDINDFATFQDEAAKNGWKVDLPYGKDADGADLFDPLGLTDKVNERKSAWASAGYDPDRNPGLTRVEPPKLQNVFMRAITPGDQMAEYRQSAERIAQLVGVQPPAPPQAQVEYANQGITTPPYLQPGTNTPSPRTATQVQDKLNRKAVREAQQANAAMQAASQPVRQAPVPVVNDGLPPFPQDQLYKADARGLERAVSPLDAAGAPLRLMSLIPRVAVPVGTVEAASAGLSQLPSESVVGVAENMFMNPQYGGKDAGPVRGMYDRLANSAGNIALNTMAGLSRYNEETNDGLLRIRQQRDKLRQTSVRDPKNWAETALGWVVDTTPYMAAAVASARLGGPSTATGYFYNDAAGMMDMNLREQGVTDKETRLKTVVPSALIYAQVERLQNAIPFVRGLGNDWAAEVVKNIARRLPDNWYTRMGMRATRLGLTGAMEGVEEPLQELTDLVSQELAKGVERAGGNPNVLDPRSISEIASQVKDTVLPGLVVGLVFGGIGGAGRLPKSDLLPEQQARMLDEVSKDPGYRANMADQRGWVSRAEKSQYMDSVRRLWGLGETDADTFGQEAGRVTGDRRVMGLYNALRPDEANAVREMERLIKSELSPEEKAKTMVNMVSGISESDVLGGAGINYNDLQSARRKDAAGESLTQQEEQAAQQTREFLSSYGVDPGQWRSGIPITARGRSVTGPDGRTVVTLARSGSPDITTVWEEVIEARFKRELASGAVTYQDVLNSMLAYKATLENQRVNARSPEANEELRRLGQGTDVLTGGQIDQEIAAAIAMIDRQIAAMQGGTDAMARRAAIEYVSSRAIEDQAGAMNVDNDALTDLVKRLSEEGGKDMRSILVRASFLRDAMRSGAIDQKFLDLVNRVSVTGTAQTRNITPRQQAAATPANATTPAPSGPTVQPTPQETAGGATTPPTRLQQVESELESIDNQLSDPDLAPDVREELEARKAELDAELFDLTEPDQQADTAPVEDTTEPTASDPEVATTEGDVDFDTQNARSDKWSALIPRMAQAFHAQQSAATRGAVPVQDIEAAMYRGLAQSVAVRTNKPDAWDSYAKRAMYNQARAEINQALSRAANTTSMDAADPDTGATQGDNIAGDTASSVSAQAMGSADEAAKGLLDATRQAIVGFNWTGKKNAVAAAYLNNLERASNEQPEASNAQIAKQLKITSQRVGQIIKEVRNKLEADPGVLAARQRLTDTMATYQVTLRAAPTRVDSLSNMSAKESRKRAKSAKFVHLQQITDDVAEAYGVRIISRRHAIGGWRMPSTDSDPDGVLSLEVPEEVVIDTTDIKIAREMAALIGASAPEMQNAVMIIADQDTQFPNMINVSVRIKSDAAAMQAQVNLDEYGIQGYTYDPGSKVMEFLVDTKQVELLRRWIDDEKSQRRINSNAQVRIDPVYGEFINDGDYAGRIEEARARFLASAPTKQGDTVADRAQRRIERQRAAEQVKARAQSLYGNRRRNRFSTPGILVDLRGMQFSNIREFVTHLDERFERLRGIKMESVGSAASIDKAAESMIDDILFSLSNDGSGMGWYDERVAEMLLELAKIHPEIADTPGDMAVYVSILAATSQGYPVVQNFKIADRVYNAWKRDGKMPRRIKFASAHEAIVDNLFTIERLIGEMGVDGFASFMDAEVTGGQLRDMGMQPTGVTLKDTVRGNRIMGPKIGSFFNNLRGRFDTITMDLWYTRTMHRYVGGLTQPLTGDKMQKAIAKFREEYKKAEGKDGTGRIYGVSRESALGNDESSVRAAMDVFGRWGRKNPYSETGYKKFADGYALERAARTIQQMAGARGAPQNKSHKAWFESIVRRAQSKLRSMGLPLSAADIQAILWYSEKSLYEKAGVANSSALPADYLDAVMNLRRNSSEGQQPTYQLVPMRIARRLKPTASTLDVERRFSDGEQLYRVHDMDERFEPIRDIGDIIGYSYDSIYYDPQNERIDDTPSYQLTFGNPDSYLEGHARTHAKHEGRDKPSYAARALRPVSTRLYKIHPDLQAMLRNYEQQRTMYVKQWGDELKPMLEAMKEIRGRTKLKGNILPGRRNEARALYDALQNAMMNGDVRASRELMVRAGYDPMIYDDALATFKKIRSQLVELGLAMGDVENYIPRMVFDKGGLDQHLANEYGVDISRLKRAMRDAYKRKNRDVSIPRPLTPFEETEVIAKLVTQQTRRGGGAFPNAKSRQLDTVMPDLVQYYTDTLDTMVKYIENAAEMAARNMAMQKLSGSFREVVQEQVNTMAELDSIMNRPQEYLRELETQRDDLSKRISRFVTTELATSQRELDRVELQYREGVKRIRQGGKMYLQQAGEIRKLGAEVDAARADFNSANSQLRGMRRRMNQLEDSIAGVADPSYQEKLADRVDELAAIIQGSDLAIGDGKSQMVGVLVKDLLDKGLVGDQDLDEIQNVLNARFNYQTQSMPFQVLKSTAYLMTLANHRAAMRNFADLTPTFVSAGLLRGVTKGFLPAAFRNITRTRGIDLGGDQYVTMEDILGDLRMNEEYRENGYLNGALQLGFKVSLFNFTDRIGKESIINANLSRMRKLARQAEKGNDRARRALLRELKGVYTIDELQKPEVIKQMASDALTEEQRRAAFGVVSDYMPVSKSEMPEFYLKGNLGKMPYMYRSYLIKFWDYAYRRMALDMRDAYNEARSATDSATRNEARVRMIKAAAEIARIPLYFTGTNVLATLMINAYLNRDDDQDEIFLQEFLQLFGFSRYYTNIVREADTGWFERLVGSFVVPLGWVGELFTDISNYLERKAQGKLDTWEGPKSTRNIPFFGIWLNAGLPFRDLAREMGVDTSDIPSLRQANKALVDKGAPRLFLRGDTMEKLYPSAINDLREDAEDLGTTLQNRSRYGGIVQAQQRMRQVQDDPDQFYRRAETLRDMANRRRNTLGLN